MHYLIGLSTPPEASTTPYWNQFQEVELRKFCDRSISVVTMSQAEVADTHDEETPGYKPPAPKPLEQILQADAEDESLKKYKEQLLGGTDLGAQPFPNDPRIVVVSKLALCSEGRSDRELDLKGDLSQLKKSGFVIKEGCLYKIKVYFYVQREIVTGLKYVQKTHRKGIQVDKSNYMVGSYGPKMEEQFYITPEEEAPSGMLMRGHYTVKSLFTDDDKHEHLKWEWALEVKKDWD